MHTELIAEARVMAKAAGGKEWLVGRLFTQLADALEDAEDVIEQVRAQVAVEGFNDLDAVAWIEHEPLFHILSKFSDDDVVDVEVIEAMKAKTI